VVRPVVRRCGRAVNSELAANPQPLKVAHVLATLRPSDAERMTERTGWQPAFRPKAVWPNGAASTTSRIGRPARR
jgi:hypothetical protein